MRHINNRALVCLLVISGGVSSSVAAPQVADTPAVTIRRIAVLGSSDDMKVEITASQPVTPQTLVMTGPDRLVIDFPNAVPGSDLHNLSVNRGELKSVRVGLFSTNPPVTRVVLDLKTPQPYQLLPSGNTVILKLSTGRKQATALPSRPAIVSRGSPPPAGPAKAAPKVEVGFQNGKLSIWANKATLAEVLYEVHRQTGADIPIPSGAEQEQVVTNIGPAPAREALSALLNGSRFNFIMVGSERDPTQLKTVLLTLKDGLPAGIVYSSQSPAPMAQAQPEPVQSENPPDPQPQAEAPLTPPPQ
jgi:hypothetical protein